MPAFRTITLAPFEACAASNPFSCSVSIQLQAGLLVLDYTVSGPLQDLIIPAAAASPCFTPELWQHSCCECFLRQADMKNYTEWNFSPCGSWWACAFDDYRAPSDKQPPGMQPQHLELRRQEGLLTLSTAIACPPVPRLRIGPALILQHAGGSRSHWAMQHPGRAPDFHHAGTCACIL